MNVLHHERAISRNDRAERSIFDHVHFFEAIDQHKTELGGTTRAPAYLGPGDVGGNSFHNLNQDKEDRNPANQHYSRYQLTIAGELKWTCL